MTALPASQSRAGSRRVAAACALLAAVVALVALAIASQSTSRAEADARTAARSFLDRYVNPNGRVVRRDQGGDTVSEGQSYGLLLAQVAGDDAAFARIWHWTRSHLQRRDGLLAYLSGPAHVKDPTPASDGDVLTAWALLRAPGSHHHSAGRRIANALLREETARRGRTSMLTAGTWATGSPVTLDPSYWSLPAFEMLGGKPGGKPFSRLASSSVSVTRNLTAGGRLLPPDWARVDGGKARPAAAPGGQPPTVQYGLDAQRLVVWMAAGCDRSARKLAAGWWPILSGPGRSGAIALDQHGKVLNGATSPLSFVASAAAADAAGRSADRDRLLGQAEAADHAHPTYYGAAWVALGRALITTRLLGGCANGGSS